jgi:hypothetical protein
MANSKDRQTADRKKQGMASVLIAIVMLVMFVLYAGLRWTNEAPAFEKTKATADTPAYMRIAGDPFLSKDFWANTRPPIFPLVLKFYAADTIKVAAFQTAFSIFAWGLLALSLAYSLKHNLLRPIVFGLILALSLDHHIAGWDVVLLTESLSVSLLALFLFAWLWLLKSWSWGKAFLLCLVAFLWAFTRDTNGWILLMLAGLIVLSVLFFGARKSYLSVAVIFVLFFAFSNLSAERGQRWVFPFQNVLAQRILPDQEAVSFFADCGMPVTPELLSLAGGYASSNDRAFYTDPALQSYRVWRNESGKSCYMRWLLSRPLTSLREPWRDLEWLLVFEEVSRFYPQRYDPVLPWYVERVLYPQDGVVWLWALTTIGALAAIWRRAWKANPAWVVFLGLCLLIYPHLFIVWHGDVPGTHRHALTISIQFVLGFWFLVLLIAERSLDFIQAKAQGERGA